MELAEVDRLVVFIRPSDLSRLRDLVLLVKFVKLGIPVEAEDV